MVRLRLEVIAPQSKKDRDKVVECSNLQRFQLRVTVLAQDDADLGEILIDGDPKQVTVLQVLAQPVGAKDTALIPLDLLSLGTSIGGARGTRLVDLSAALPIAARERQAKIEKFIKRLRREPLGDEVSEQMKQLIEKGGEPLVKFLEQLFVENRVGRYQLQAVLTSQRSEGWKGTVKSQPVEVRIRDDGEFFKQEVFR